MRSVAYILKNMTVLFSLASLVACGNMSASISPASDISAKSKATTAQAEDTQFVPDLLQTIPLHDTGGTPADEIDSDYASDNSTVQAQSPVVDDSNPTSSTTTSTETSANNDTTATPQVPKADPKPSEPVKPTPPHVDGKVAEAGNIKPTVYYFPVFNEDKDLCDKGDVKTLHGVNGEKIMNVCPNTLAACGLQGSCAIIQKGVRRSFNISDRVNGVDRFFEMTNKECPYGYGVKSSCLDPFYTLAADMDIYKAGDVIFIPSVVGLKLPDGSTHNGYFIVRDQGRGINGKGRFDFYSGFLSWRDAKNPFRKLGFDDTKTAVPYQKIVGDKAEQILRSRSYPRLPVVQKKPLPTQN